MSITHLLNRALDHYRIETTRNSTGGLDETRVLVGQVEVRVPQPSATERVMARTQVGPQQGAAELTQPVYTEADSGVRRGDELQDPTTGEGFRVKDAIRPSEADDYLRLDTEVFQVEITVEAS
ncbi:hypothetical protein [Nocardiopsis lucentensis]|uniref:hypothetical protein n=1 Tax=Nocardiopsis lucentensis TaxID=53441 RepID=UPI000346710A|nr:hypothetical protein [Nocardiopsis lucentensis]